MKHLTFLILSVGLFSCVNTKKTSTVWITKNQTIYQKTNATIGSNLKDSVIEITLIKGAKAKITEPQSGEELLRIKFVENVLAKFSNRIARESTTKDPAGNGYYFPGSPDVPSGVGLDETFSSKKFIYWEIKPVLQTLAIPVKYRPSIRDTIKSSASAAFNVGFTYAYKFTRNNYKKIFWNDNSSASFLSHRQEKIHYAIGPFLGPAIIDLKSTNTDGIAIKDRSVVAATYGILGVIGYNELNAGISFGWDNIFKTEKGSWIYNKKPWIGIVIAIDIIK